MKSKALVWGNGKSAYTVANYVRTELSASMDCVGFYVSNCKILNKDVNEPVYTMDEVVSDNNEIADVLIIPNPGKKISDILFEHRTIKNKRILFVSAENIRRPNKAKYFFEISGKKPWLNGFEYHVVDHCNLNCKGCGHCANLFNAPSFGDIDVYERDLKRLSELFEGVGLIRLLGGEPLLNGDLKRYIEITRTYFKLAEIHIVTNGILIPSMGKDFLRFLNERGVIVDISVYPPVEKRLSTIIDTLKLSDIEFNVMPVEQFYKRFSLTGKFDKCEAFYNCGTATCHTLFDGKIAPCIVPFSTEKLNREFNINIPIDGWIDLFENEIDGDTINERLKQPFELCSHCNPQKSFFAWEQRRFEDCKLEDWTCD